MSYDFINHKQVKGRKHYTCEQCRKSILPGEKHNYCCGKFEGEFIDYREHNECRDAWVAINDLRGGMDSDGAPFLRDDDIEPQEKELLITKYPEVAKRLGFVKQVFTP